jgi:hypothetical protein
MDTTLGAGNQDRTTYLPKNVNHDLIFWFVAINASKHELTPLSIHVALESLCEDDRIFTISYDGSNTAKFEL